MLPLFPYYLHHPKRTFGRLWVTEESDYPATNAALDDKKAEITDF